MKLIRFVLIKFPEKLIILSFTLLIFVVAVQFIFGWLNLECIQALNLYDDCIIGADKENPRNIPLISYIAFYLVACLFLSGIVWLVGKGLLESKSTSRTFTRIWLCIFFSVIGIAYLISEFSMRLVS